MRLVPSITLACLLAAFPSAARAGKAVDGVINLNTAPVEVLGLLPGVGPAKAAEIAAYRRRRPFRTVDELVRIKGIGRKMVRRLRAHLAIAGPTTATAIAGHPGVVAVAPPPPAPPAVHPPVHPLCPRPTIVAVARGFRRATAERWPIHSACLRPR